MDVLVIGGVSNLVNGVIDKLNKEGHRIYVLTGSQYQVPGYRRTFEKYYFDYAADSVEDVFNSVRPDVTIFTGAYDSHFTWVNPRREARNYAHGLENILLSFAAQKKGRFIYISSQEVFRESRPYNIPEKESIMIPVSDIRPNALYHGENACLDYANVNGCDVVILRLDHIYDTPKKKHQVTNICAYMCLEALENKRLTADGNKIFSLLYLSDAVEFLYKVVVCKTHKSNLYHISSTAPLSELQIAGWIGEAMDGEIEIVDETRENETRMVLSNLLFDREFHIRIFNKPEVVVKQMAQAMKAHAKEFIQTREKVGRLRNFWNGLKTLLQAAIPFVENLICFIPFFLLNNRAVGNRYFDGLDLYLLYVLLFAVVYGQQQATVSALLSLAGYLYRQTFDRSGLDVMLDYQTYIWMAQLFVVGLSVGYVKDQLNLVKGHDENEFEYLTSQLNDVLDINSSNVRMKNILETQVVNQNDSLGKIYEITSGLDKYEPEEVLFYAAEILAKLIGSEHVAIYSVANRSYARLFSATSTKARMLGNSINYTELTDVYDSMKQRKVYVNKSMDNRYPEMAVAIYSEDDMQLLLMVWGIPWERMTLGQSNVLAVIGYLIQNAVVRANRYMEALQNQRYVAGTRILETDAFVSLVKAYMGARRKNLTECAIIAIDVEVDAQESAGEKLSKLLRQSDFLGRLMDGNLYALLSNTNNKSAEFVIKRFGEAGYGCHLQEEISI
jgi:nucleoside-diphosphate-sugar epimerase